jgi:hypothetical protein
MFQDGQYGPAVAAILKEKRLMCLGPGEPNLAAREMLIAARAECLFEGQAHLNGDMAQACLAGLWLYHDFLAESHGISQQIHSPTGSYWHGIMHRREPDAGNAAYWFRKVGKHPIFTPLANEAREINKPGSLKLLSGSKHGSAQWDPFEFIELCDKHRGRNDGGEMLCRRLQQREWELLFDFCYRCAQEPDQRIP